METDGQGQHMVGVHSSFLSSFCGSSYDAFVNLCPGLDGNCARQLYNMYSVHRIFPIGKIDASKIGGGKMLSLQGILLFMFLRLV